MTKAITGAAAVELVEQDKLELDTSASEWALDLSTRPVLEGFDTAGRPGLRPANGAITQRHLLSHAAGLGYGIWSEDLAHYEQVTNVPSSQSGKRAALRMPLLFGPGGR